MLLRSIMLLNLLYFLGRLLKSLPLSGTEILRQSSLFLSFRLPPGLLMLLSSSLYRDNVKGEFLMNSFCVVLRPVDARVGRVGRWRDSESDPDPTPLDREIDPDPSLPRRVLLYPEEMPWSSSETSLSRELLPSRENLETRLDIGLRTEDESGSFIVEYGEGDTFPVLYLISNSSLDTLLLATGLAEVYRVGLSSKGSFVTLLRPVLAELVRLLFSSTLDK